ncbi:MAG TPA: UbiA family prenyltransferase [Candidatus Nanopelagicales bacterium]
MASRGREVALGLLLGCHLAPTLTVTVAITGLAWAAGRTGPGLLWVAAAMLSGQLAVGWCNDARDAGRDRAAGRRSKPTVRGWVTAGQLATGSVLAAVACVPLSYAAAGPVGGSAHVVAVASALSYDLWLKTTVLSVVPYAVSFGLIPAFVTYGLTPPSAPAPWVVATGALLGIGAHLANAAPDVQSDLAVGAGGLVSRIGARNARVGAVVALLLSTALLVRQLDVSAWLGVVLLLALTAVAVVAATWRSGRRLFEAVLVLAIVDVALLFAAAASIRA